MCYKAPTGNVKRKVRRSNAPIKDGHKFIRDWYYDVKTKTYRYKLIAL